MFFKVTDYVFSVSCNYWAGAYKYIYGRNAYADSDEFSGTA